MPVVGRRGSSRRAQDPSARSRYHGGVRRSIASNTWLPLLIAVLFGCAEGTEPPPVPDDGTGGALDDGTGPGNAASGDGDGDGGDGDGDAGTGGGDGDGDGDGNGDGDGDGDVSPGLKRKVLTIQGSQVPAAQPGFPVLVRITDADLAAGADPAGLDIYFESVGGAPLAFERESYDSATGTLVAWVTMTLTGSDQPFDLYYGDGDQTEKSSPADVWGVGFAAVYHMGGGGASEADSSGNTNNLTAASTPPADVPGQIGRALDFEGGATWLTAPDSPSLDISSEVTISAWARTSANNPSWWEAMVSKRIGFDTVNYHLGLGGPTSERNVLWYDGNPNLPPASDHPLADETPTLIAVTVKSGTCSWYFDGVLQGPEAGCGLTPNDGLLYVGGFDQQTDEVFHGWLDEVRIASVARSTNWLLTEFNNQKADSTFMTVGPEQDP